MRWWGGTFAFWAGAQFAFALAVYLLTQSVAWWNLLFCLVQGGLAIWFLRRAA